MYSNNFMLFRNEQIHQNEGQRCGVWCWMEHDDSMTLKKK